MGRAPFFSLDGLDGAGKSTQCRMLADWLRRRGFNVTECSDPGGTEIGRVLRGLLLDHKREITMACEAFLFMASRAQLVAEVIRPALDSGQAVVSDRFQLANIVYQGHAGGLPIPLLGAMNHIATGNLVPDLTFVLDLPIELAMARRQGPADRVEFRSIEYHNRVRQGFQTEAMKQPEAILLIDASQSIEKVHDQICKAAEKWLLNHP